MFFFKQKQFLAFCGLLLFFQTFDLVCKADPPHIHILVVADTADANIGVGVGKSVPSIQNTFARLVPQDRYTLRLLKSSEIAYNARTIIDLIQSTKVANDDTFVFFYLGHGAREHDHHFLQLPGGGRLWSKTLQDVIRAKPCDLKIIITDSCNVDLRLPLAAGQAPIWMGPPWNPNQDGIAPVMEELFIKHSGLLHMNSANIGQFGFTNRQTGSWFFGEFLGYLDTHYTGRPTWAHIDHMMDRVMNRKFIQMREMLMVNNPHIVQTSLYPITWSYPTPWPNRSTRFGVVAIEQPNSSGVVVKQVYDQSAGSRFAIFDPGEPPGFFYDEARIREANGFNGKGKIDSLRAGDIIVTINGEFVSDSITFEELVSCSSRTMTFGFKRGLEYHTGYAYLAW